MHELFSWPWIESQVDRSIGAWNECAALPIPPGPRYTPDRQRVREQAYDDGLRSLELELKSSRRLGASPSRAERLAAQDRITAAFAAFAATALDLDDQAVHLITDGFLPQGTLFARQSRRFDPRLTMAEIVQACRNAWTACGLQPLLAEPSGITPSILGYSLLYPYTDNFLDDKNTSPEAKLRFCRRFHDRLSGLALPVESGHEASIWALVRMIEGQYPRTRFPQVYRCLLAIHRAQQESIVQLKHGALLGSSEILRISCAKGGSSVLADACLVRGSLTKEESQLSFDWGALLQLGDDLQDIAEDLDRGSATLFTRAAAQGQPLDGLVAQMLNFSEQISNRIACLPDGSPALKGLLRMSWRSLIIAAVANAHQFFSSRFLQEAERCSPLRFQFLRQRNRKLASRKGLYAEVFEALLESDDQAPAPPVALRAEQPSLQLLSS